MNKRIKYIIFLFVLLFLFLFVSILFFKNIESFEFNNQPNYLSVLAILKNESMNLKVWVDHYLWQGVEQIYIIDNGSTDNSVEIIKDLQSKGYPIILYELPEKHSQLKHYRSVYDQEELWKKTKWLIIADLDEFFYCNNSTLKDELKKYEDKHVIYSAWHMFGSNNLINHPEDIRTSIINREPDHHELTKYIFQPVYISSDQINNHKIDNISDENTSILSDIFRLNHYSIQSCEYFEKVKMTRGDVYTQKSENVRDWNYFERYDKDTSFEDSDLKNMVLNIKK